MPTERALSPDPDDLPPGILPMETVPHLPGASRMMQDAIVLEMRTEAENEERTAEEAAKAAVRAEADAEAALEPSDAILTREPPGDLDVDTTGLPPKRARLVRYDAWRAAMRVGLEEMEQGRANFLTQMGAPAITQSKLDALIAADKTGMLAWLRKGASPALGQPQARSFERQKLEEKLAADSHQAEVALDAFDALNDEIDLRKREIAALEDRHRSFVHDAIVERAEALGVTYVKQIAELQHTIAELRGLAAIFRGSFYQGYAVQTEMKLPSFNLPAVPGYRGAVVQPYAPMQPVIRVTEADAEAAGQPWRDLADLWAKDPRAEPPPLTAVDTQAEAAPHPAEPEIDAEQGADHADD